MTEHEREGLSLPNLLQVVRRRLGVAWGRRTPSTRRRACSRLRGATARTRWLPSRTLLTGSPRRCCSCCPEPYRRQYGFDSCAPVIANLYGPNDKRDDPPARGLRGGDRLGHLAPGRPALALPRRLPRAGDDGLPRGDRARGGTRAHRRELPGAGTARPRDGLGRRTR